MIRRSFWKGLSGETMKSQLMKVLRKSLGKPFSNYCGSWFTFGTDGLTGRLCEVPGSLSVLPFVDKVRMSTGPPPVVWGAVQVIASLIFLFYYCTVNNFDSIPIFFPLEKVGLNPFWKVGSTAMVSWYFLLTCFVFKIIYKGWRWLYQPPFQCHVV